MWAQLILWVVTSIISAALAPKPQKPQPGQLSGAPLASAGAPIPVLFGKRIITQANCVWWGDVKSVAIKSKGGKK